MPDGLTILELFLALAVLLPIAVLVFVFGRRRWLAQQGWVFDCSLFVLPPAPSSRWSLGVARIVGERLQWYRAFSLSLRPAFTLRRRDTHLVVLREATATEQAYLYDQVCVVEVSSDEGSVELAMSSANITAFLSWLEASPPGVDFP